METNAKRPTTRRLNHNVAKTLRNNARLSAHTRKFLGNMRNTVQRGEHIPRKFVQFIGRTVKEELKNRKTMKHFYKNYQTYAVNEK